MAVGVARPVLGRLGPADDEAIDDDLDRVALVLVERRRLGQVVLLAVHPDPDEALLAGRLEDPVALGLAVLDERAEDEQPGPLGHRQDLVDDLLDGLALDLAAAGGAVRVADPGEQQAEVVVDLGDRPDGGPRVPAGALLVDRDRRREPVDLVDVRLLHLAQELAGVGATGSRRSGAGPRRRSCRRRGCDFPLPDSPVITTSRSRGNSTVTFLRLCSRAPRTTIRSWGTPAVYRNRVKQNRCSCCRPAGRPIVAPLALALRSVFLCPLRHNRNKIREPRPGRAGI